MKYVLVALVLLVALHIWRRNRRTIKRPRPTRSVARPEDMVTCAHCGLHLPSSDAVSAPSQQTHYCSAEHQRLGPR